MEINTFIYMQEIRVRKTCKFYGIFCDTTTVIQTTPDTWLVWSVHGRHHLGGAADGRLASVGVAGPSTGALTVPQIWQRSGETAEAQRRERKCKVNTSS